MNNNVVVAKGGWVKGDGEGYEGGQMVVEEDLTWGSEHTIQCIDGVFGIVHLTPL